MATSSIAGSLHHHPPSPPIQSYRQRGVCEQAIVSAVISDGVNTATVGPLSFDMALLESIKINNTIINISPPCQVVLKRRGDPSGVEVDPEFGIKIARGYRVVTIDVCDASSDFFDSLTNFFCHGAYCRSPSVGRSKLVRPRVVRARIDDDMCQVIDDMIMGFGEAVSCVYDSVEKFVDIMLGVDETKSSLSCSVRSTGGAVEATASTSTTSSSSSQTSTSDMMIVSSKDSTPTLADEEGWEFQEAFDTTESEFTSIECESSDDDDMSFVGTPRTGFSDQARSEIDEAVARAIGAGLSVTDVTFGGNDGEKIEAVVVDCDVADGFCQIECDESDDGSWVAI
ncbi:hypothetical protein FOL47_007641 [Perkinsus chesapeaki]|uniref:Uncharacterized protein n=1 Tax=Perkinsus chesapeaki TaxID=330153 RepID=A0A7J6MVD5_PERCH|nr:hypothetical protein FOL47_007641 [Perkinsus chesapeaki]